MGKTDKRLHARTQASDFGDRWAATFGGKGEEPLPDDDTILRGIGVPNANAPLRLARPYGLDATPERP